MNQAAVETEQGFGELAYAAELGIEVQCAVHDCSVRSMTISPS